MFDYIFGSEDEETKKIKEVRNRLDKLTRDVNRCFSVDVDSNTNYVGDDVIHPYIDKNMILRLEHDRMYINYMIQQIFYTCKYMETNEEKCKQIYFQLSVQGKRLHKITGIMEQKKSRQMFCELFHNNIDMDYDNL